MSTAVMWFRRDLRISDNPALLAALESADEVLPLFVLDDHLRKPSGAPRLAFLYGCLQDLHDTTDGHLVIRHGDPANVVERVAREVDATEVYCTEDFGPYGRYRDEEVLHSLEAHGRSLQRLDSNYAVEPGGVVKNDGTPFKVFTPFSRAWESHGWGKPRAKPRSPKWVGLEGSEIPHAPEVDAELPRPGEAAAIKRLEKFVDGSVKNYKSQRDVPGVQGTSRMSPYLKYGCVHPRQVLDKLGAGIGASTYRTEICWRDFYADVLFHNPGSIRHSLQKGMSNMKVDSGKRADERLDAWKAGSTGFPIVDAGMRQLLGEAWMHNRVRMIVASFLVKDLHIDWLRGARHFLDCLVDGDIASNNHGWQWVAGTGTDPAPYFRIFNPVTQGKKFDPDAAYIRRWVPELADVPDKYVHEPWKNPDGLPNGYPEPIVDHDTERKEALSRYRATR